MGPLPRAHLTASAADSSGCPAMGVTFGMPKYTLTAAAIASACICKKESSNNRSASSALLRNPRSNITGHLRHADHSVVIRIASAVPPRPYAPATSRPGIPSRHLRKMIDQEPGEPTGPLPRTRENGVDGMMSLGGRIRSPIGVEADEDVSKPTVRQFGPFRQTQVPVIAPGQ